MLKNKIKFILTPKKVLWCLILFLIGANGFLIDLFCLSPVAAHKPIKTQLTVNMFYIGNQSWVVTDYM